MDGLIFRTPFKKTKIAIRGYKKEINVMELAVIVGIVILGASLIMWAVTR